MKKNPKLTFDEKSPITGNHRVLVEILEFSDKIPIKNKLCMDSGYHTYEPSWHKDNPDFISMMNQVAPEPESIEEDDIEEINQLRRLQFVDDSGNVWFPVNKTGIIMNEEIYKSEVGKALAILQPQFKDDTYTEFEWIILIVSQEDVNAIEPTISLYKTFEKLQFEAALDEFVSMIQSAEDSNTQETDN